MQQQASTYVLVTRQNLEEWLDSLPLKGKWHLKPNRAGVYLLPLSDVVAVQLNSTIGSADDAMGRGMASMHLSLVSLVTGQTLNKKAQGQDHFKRTTNWRQTWKLGFNKLKDAYMKSQGFYDAIASIEDREAYKHNLLDQIEKVSGWESDPFITDIHARILKDGILTSNQENALVKALGQLKKQPAAPVKEEENPVIERMRVLFLQARKRDDKWLMDFLTSIAAKVKRGDSLTDRQQEVLDQNLSRYRVANRFLHKLLTHKITV